MSTETPLLEAQGISKRFGSVQALYKVDLTLHAGEVLALVGDNGAGKSTLIKAISGNYPIDEGRFFFEGSEVRIDDPKDASDLGIEVVYQDLALCDNLTVTQNMFLGREEVSSLGVLSESAMRRRAAETMKSLAVTTLGSVDLNVARLSGGQRQSVAVAKAVMWNSKVVILDEPTAALGVAQTRQVLDLVVRLAQQGLGVIVISHNLHDLFEIADRFLVLRLGQSIGTYDRAATTQQEIVEAITAGALSVVPGQDTSDLEATV
ncbi:MAG: ATP-binding cassette domain-containing protein [Acidimicrobiales bacterium]